MEEKRYGGDEQDHIEVQHHKGGGTKPKKNSEVAK